jgi:hypothetical protein
MSVYWKKKKKIKEKYVENYSLFVLGKRKFWVIGIVTFLDAETKRGHAGERRRAEKEFKKPRP